MINITYNPKFDLYLASIPAKGVVEFNYNAKGKLALNGDPVAYTRSEVVHQTHVLAVAKTPHEATIQANIKLKRTA